MVPSHDVVQVLPAAEIHLLSIAFPSLASPHPHSLSYDESKPGALSPVSWCLHPHLLAAPLRWSAGLAHQ